MIAGNSTISEKAVGRVDEQGLLFEYAIKFLLLAAFLELVLYRLISRLGMHLSKLAAQYDWIRLLFKGLSSIGFTLLNVVSLLVFLCLCLLLFIKAKNVGHQTSETWLVATVSLLLVLTVAFLFLPQTMLAPIVYNIVTTVALVVLTAQYVKTHHLSVQRLMLLSFVLGIGGWLYYQTISTVYGFWEILDAPPFAHEVNRLGEALMVLSSILALWAYGGLSWRTTNKRQRRRLYAFALTGGTIFIGLLLLDYVLGLYDRASADSIRKAGEGIGWIFQMGMGYTFYLPFALYVAGLFGWSYAVIKQISMGRVAGYGLGLMFMAGYALQLSHLTLMVVLGLLLLNLDRQRLAAKMPEAVGQTSMVGAPSAMVGERT